MDKYKNKDRFDVCTMLGTFHGVWKEPAVKDMFARYVSKNFRYAVLSDEYKHDKPDPIIEKYFQLIYDFNVHGLVSIRDYKNIQWPMKKNFKPFQVNQLFRKNEYVSFHKLYIPK